jgi:demethylmenaquinone methyltransferase / 2-methoxy-6-polyprenyl-1,4-benzoquinol methylase
MVTLSRMSNTPVGDALVPHPDLPEYYRGAERKRMFLREIFDQTAGDYDRVERLLALGSGRWYRRKALVRAGLCSGMRVLDVAAGTGLVAREALQLVGAGGRVLGVDPSEQMLRQAHDMPGVFAAVLGRGELLPVADWCVDFVSMGYALRHLPDLNMAFAEFHRVLRPGGKVCILEITRPSGWIRRQLLQAYFHGVLPLASRIMRASSATQRLWQYYWETIDRCVAPTVVLGALSSAGFTEVGRTTSLGIFSEYTATKAAAGDRPTRGSA